MISVTASRRGFSTATGTEYRSTGSASSSSACRAVVSPTGLMPLTSSSRCRRPSATSRRSHERNDTKRLPYDHRRTTSRFQRLMRADMAPGEKDIVTEHICRGRPRGRHGGLPPARPRSDVHRSPDGSVVTARMYSPISTSGSPGRNGVARSPPTSPKTATGTSIPTSIERSRSERLRGSRASQTTLPLRAPRRTGTSRSATPCPCSWRGRRQGRTPTGLAKPEQKVTVVRDEFRDALLEWRAQFVALVSVLAPIERSVAHSVRRAIGRAQAPNRGGGCGRGAAGRSPRRADAAVL